MTVEALNRIAPLATAAGITTAKQLGQFARAHRCRCVLDLVQALTNAAAGATM
jgi:hypothetical protein